jgi:hypothetical protein
MAYSSGFGLGRSLVTGVDYVKMQSFAMTNAKLLQEMPTKLAGWKESSQNSTPEDRSIKVIAPKTNMHIAKQPIAVLDSFLRLENSVCTEETSRVGDFALSRSEISSRSGFRAVALVGIGSKHLFNYDERKL